VTIAYFFKNTGVNLQNYTQCPNSQDYNIKEKEFGIIKDTAKQCDSQQTEHKRKLKTLTQK
jgi:hypothetical protein